MEQDSMDIIFSSDGTNNTKNKKNQPNDHHEEKEESNIPEKIASQNDSSLNQSGSRNSLPNNNSISQSITNSDIFFESDHDENPQPQEKPANVESNRKEKEKEK